MTRLTGITPDPVQFAQAWREEFGPAIRAASGSDGRVSKPEAEKIIRRADYGRFASDNAVQFFKDSGQQTVAVEKLIDILAAQAQAAASAVAGANQKLSLAEGKKLAPAWRNDFFYLRGKLAQVPERTWADFVAESLERVKAAISAGTLTKLNGVPSAVWGTQEIAIHQVPGENAKYYIHVGAGTLYVSLAMSGPPPVPQVGWYRVGPAPDPVEI